MTGRIAIMRCIVALASLAALAVASPSAASESSFRCDGGIVAVGDTKLDLLGKCGEPALREDRSVVQGAITRRGAPVPVAASTIESWTYNFGPQRFIELVTLEGGKVVALERGGYGYDPAKLSPHSATGRATCESSAIHIGDTTLDLLARCGEPATRDVTQEPRAVPVAVSGPPGFVTVQVETWTYDFGPQRFIAIVKLEDGKIVSVESGGYGYAR
jgi:hypothetical protein